MYLFIKSLHNYCAINIKNKNFFKSKGKTNILVYFEACDVPNKSERRLKRRLVRNFPLHFLI